jgi:hypothetical protein
MGISVVMVVLNITLEAEAEREKTELTRQTLLMVGLGNLVLSQVFHTTGVVVVVELLIALDLEAMVAMVEVVEGLLALPQVVLV